MKQWLKSCGCVLLILCLVVGITACGKNDPDSSDPTNSSSISDTSADVTDPTDPDATSGDGTQTSGSPSNTSGSKNNPGKNTTTTRGQTNNSTNNGVAPEKLRGTTMEYLTWLDTNQSGNSLAEENKVVSDFERASGITVRWTKIAYATFDSTFASRMAADNAPDMTYLNAIILPRVQYLQPISAMNYDFSDGSVWDQDTIKNYTIKGKAYAVNMVGSKSLLWRPQILFYNKNEVKKAEQEDPYTLWKAGKWTWNKMIAISKAYYRATGNPGFSVSDMWQYAQLKGVQGPFSFDGSTIKSNFENRQLLDTLNQQADWKSAGIESKNLMDIGGISRGQLIFFSYNMSVARSGHQYLENLKNNNTLGFVPMPKIDGQNTQYMLGEQSAYGVCKGAKNPEAVAYFLRYYLDKSHYDESKFFYNSEALETYYYAVSQKKLATTDMLNGQSQSGSRIEKVQGELWNTEKAQLPSKIESLATNQIKPDIDTAESLLKKNF